MSKYQTRCRLGNYVLKLKAAVVVVVVVVVDNDDNDDCSYRRHEYMKKYPGRNQHIGLHCIVYSKRDRV